jgi:hypothetical protein
VDDSLDSLFILVALASLMEFELSRNNFVLMSNSRKSRLKEL